MDLAMPMVTSPLYRELGKRKLLDKSQRYQLNVGWADGSNSEKLSE